MNTGGKFGGDEVLPPSKFRPFHETIVDVISRASLDQLEILGDVIKTTKIPKGHAEIIAAWEKRKNITYSMLDLGVTSSLREQMEIAAAEPPREG